MLDSNWPNKDRECLPRAEEHFLPKPHGWIEQILQHKTSVCVCTRARTSAHVCRENKGQLWVEHQSCLPCCLNLGLLLPDAGWPSSFQTLCGFCLPAPHGSTGVAHMCTGVIYTCVTVTGFFTWVLVIWTPVLTHGRQALYPLIHFAINFNKSKKPKMI